LHCPNPIRYPIYSITDENFIVVEKKDGHKSINIIYNINMKKTHHLILFLTFSLMLVSCQSSKDQSTDTSPTDIPVSTSIANSPLTEEDRLTPTQSTSATEIVASTLTITSLPLRAGPRTQTSGTVPHVQIDAAFNKEVVDELIKLAFSLPGVENRPTIVSLPGTKGMWLSDEITVAHPEVIVSGREFAHIHPDGSLHVPLSFERALEAHEMNWAERHPWADDREGWDGLVMLFTPQSMDEVEIVFQLIIESYNYVTGNAISALDLIP
jgi:hypothetical protein